MAQPKELTFLSATVYEEKAHDRYPVSCPSLDLSATWDNSRKDLLVYRPPGQIVSKIHQVGAPGQKAPEAVALRWKPDGQFLAVGWSDGSVRLMGLENNKAAHHIHVCDPAATRITHIGWASSQITDKNVKPLPEIIRNAVLEENNFREDDMPIDLPQELMFLEVESALPKISPLPSGSAGAGEDAMVFTLRTGIEFLFQPAKREDYDQVNVMVVGTSNSQLHLSICDSFLLGSMECLKSDLNKHSQLIHHASHPKISTQALLLAEETKAPEEVNLVPLDLPFITTSPINLSLLTSKLTTLQKLLRYIKQTQLHMQVEWKNTTELPSRFLRSVEGDLEGMPKGPRGIVPALCHTVLTGHAYEPVREWLVDSLAERGHKRWDKAVVSGLEALRGLVHENLLPALDRCDIILSRLRGLAQFYDDRDDIGFTATQIGRVMDITSCLCLIGHKLLVNIVDELEHFKSFSTWLRFQIDRFASSSNDELTEKEATLDTAKILKYIKRYLTSSPLSIFFEEVDKAESDAAWAHVEDGASLLELLDAQLKKCEAGQPSMKALPRVEFLVAYATTWSNRIFNSIAQANRRTARFGSPIKLKLGSPITLMDMKLCRMAKNKGAKVFTALTSKEIGNQVYMFCSDITIVNGISNNDPVTTSCCVDLESRKLVDFKFLNENTLIILCMNTDNKPQVISVQIQSDKLPYSTYNADSLSDISKISAGELSDLSFPEGTIIRPLRMEVYEKSDVRGEIPARISVLETNRTSVKTFAFPQSS